MERDFLYHHKPLVNKNINGASKCEIIMVLSNYSLFQYWDSNIGLFSIAPCAIIILNFLCFIFEISSLLLFLTTLPKYIALPTIVRSIVDTLTCSYFHHNSWRAITIWKAIQKRSHEPFYKTIIKMIKSDNFCYCQILKSNNYMGSN